MNLQDMLGRVSTITGMEQEDAEQATRAFLETLAVRLGNTEAQELAAQLPTELQDCLFPTEPEVEKLSSDQFLSRFASAAGVDEAQSDQTAQAVWRVIREAVDDGEMGDVKSQLPNELNRIFEPTSFRSSSDQNK